MKPCNERIPLIDAAIDKGYVTVPIGMDFLFMDKHGHRYWGSDKCSSGRYGCYKFICTSDELEHRKAELQNKPNWEDAPKWSNWLAQDSDGKWWWYKSKPIAKEFCFMHGGRCMPSGVGKVIGNWQDTLEQRPEQKEQDMNDWYEKGERPPIGVECQFIVDVSKLPSDARDYIEFANTAPYLPITCKVTHYGKSHFLYESQGQEYSMITAHVEFRPLRTETDKLVEQMEIDAETKGSNSAYKRLVAKGYRKIKPMSEQEFMKQCVDICGHGDTRLYRAGCRFLDKGE